VLLVLLIAFVGAMAYLIAASMVPRDVPTFMPSPFDAGDGDGKAGDRRVDTVTFDARDAERWHYFSLSRGVPLVPPDTAGWEVAVRRYHLVVPGAAADMGPVEFASVDVVPDSGFVMPDGRDDAGHPAIRRWYRYGMFTHLLESKQHVYAARMSDGTYAALQVLSYYCPGPRPGCLTIRYRRPLSGEHRADGSPRRRRDLASDAEP
jgi:hypothetical protein